MIRGRVISRWHDIFFCFWNRICLIGYVVLITMSSSSNAEYPDLGKP